jgi:hypothetical protein
VTWIHDREKLKRMQRWRLRLRPRFWDWRHIAFEVTMIVIAGLAWAKEGSALVAAGFVLVPTLIAVLDHRMRWVRVDDETIHIRFDKVTAVARRDVTAVRMKGYRSELELAGARWHKLWGSWRPSDLQALARELGVPLLDRDGNPVSSERELTT